MAKRELKQLTSKHLSAAMRSVVCSLSHGGTLYSTGSRRWLSTGFEAGVTAATFFALLRRGLIRPTRRTSLCWDAVKRYQFRYVLSNKGYQWARLPWTPARLRRATA